MENGACVHRSFLAAACKYPLKSNQLYWRDQTLKNLKVSLIEKKMLLPLTSVAQLFAQLLGLYFEPCGHWSFLMKSLPLESRDSLILPVYDFFNDCSEINDF